MLYECLTGEVPFHANNYLGIISQVLTRDAPPPSRLRPELGIPPAVETVVMRAMEKDRQKRYQTMADLEQDLERLLAGDQNVGAAPGALGTTPPELAAVEPSVLRRWRLAFVGSVVMAAGIAIALRHPSDAHPTAPDDEAAQNVPAAPAAPPVVTPPPALAPPVAPAPPLAVEARAVTVQAAVASRPARVAAAHRKPVHGDHKGDADEKPAVPKRVEPSESVKRGVLPPHSGEAYPD
jgi:serine/threonine-protein kinase